MRLKKHLESKNVEVYEYLGGHYTHAPLLKCDVLIIVPDETTNRGNKVTIGKGLAEQIQQFTYNPKNKTKVFVYVGGDIANIINGNLMLSHYQLLSVIDSTNFINFATMYFGDVISLSDVLGNKVNSNYEDVIDTPKVKLKIDNTNMHLSIKL
jgi:hypothetical protein